mmetsp:Transcript_120453/g.213037  ORF Transcript_120453/g.213037 Transcript_120453/m.213037 type:complete len:111 (-) Transcript_120453:94-426(-)
MASAEGPKAKPLPSRNVAASVLKMMAPRAVKIKAKPNTDAPEADEDQAPEEEMAAADAYGGETGGVSTQEATQSGESAGVEGDGYGDQEEEADAEKGDEEVEEENVDEME